MASSYYEKGEVDGIEYFEKCLNAIGRYEKLDNSIFRKDSRLAQTLPCVICAAREVLSEEQYVVIAEKYAQMIEDNTYNSDWTLRYFTAQTYIDLYDETKDKFYLQKAYEIAFDNVNELKQEQNNQNEIYLQDLVLRPTKKVTDEEKKENEAYNEFLENNRKIEIPPVYEPLRLNCELLFALAKQLEISEVQKADIDSILHPDGTMRFLNPIIDNYFRFTKYEQEINTDEMTVSYDKDKLILPAMYLTDGSSIVVTVCEGASSQIIQDWKLESVDRNKSHELSEFMAIFSSDEAEDVTYKNGDIITVSVTTPITDDASESFDFRFNVVEKTVAFVMHPLSFERIVE